MTARVPLTPEIIAAHLRTTTEPRMRAAAEMLAGVLGQPLPKMMTARILGAANTIERIDLVALSLHLAHQRALAEHGRPKGEHSGKSSVTPRPTESAAVEADRIRAAGLALREALDRIMPDPEWPGVRVATATEAAERVAGECWGTLSPAQSWDDLHDAADVIADVAREAWRLAQRCLRIHAWGRDPEDVEPPDLTRCAGRIKGEPCGNHVSVHHHPDTGSVHHADLCDDCYRLVCPVCWERPRRTPNARECSRCESRARRAA